MREREMREKIEGIQRNIADLCRNFRETIWLPFFSTSANNNDKKKASTSNSVFLLLFLPLFFLGSFFATRLLDSIVTAFPVRTPSQLVSTSNSSDVQSFNSSKIPKKPPRKVEIPLNCSSTKLIRTCPLNYYPTRFPPFHHDPNDPPPATCPDYFRWIHEDLRPWRETGITSDTLERAKGIATFRLVIVNGRAYVERLRRTFQTRDVFTLWGILQLLRRYPGKVPDLELMFDCFDRPVVRSSEYSGPNATLLPPPPLFRYCGDDTTLDIVFPDWSFWGWPELNIKPWEGLLEDLKEGNKRKRWLDREGHAYWKGNPMVAANRIHLLTCNLSLNQDWGALLYSQDWARESQQGYKQSDLGSQCIHRYKIYIEGTAWSVSEKYILGCDSVTLMVKPHYYDFFTRSLMPVHHYWPIRDDNNKCKSIRFAVDWGNTHKQKAQDIGKAASDFIQEDLKMDFVYDYMFHLLNEYAKLFKYKPTVPKRAIELCSEAMACSAKGLKKKFMMESMAKGPINVASCAMPPPYDRVNLQSLLERKANSIRQVESWEKKYWENRSMDN